MNCHDAFRRHIKNQIILISIHSFNERPEHSLIQSSLIFRTRNLQSLDVLYLYFIVLKLCFLGSLLCCPNFVFIHQLWIKNVFYFWQISCFYSQNFHETCGFESPELWTLTTFLTWRFKLFCRRVWNKKKLIICEQI